MTNGVEAVGEAVTGGMFARAVEPEAGESDRPGEGQCLNCGAPLDGPYCSRCGQKAHIHRSVGAVAHDLVHGILHLDGKFWHTLPMLLFKPGELTRRYIHGERARFVSPFAMFLFSVFTMFAVLQIYGLSLSALENGPMGAAGGMAMAEQGVAAELERARADKRERLTEQKDNPKTPERVATLDQRIAELEEDQRELAKVRQGMTTFSNTGTGVQTGWKRLDEGIKKIQQNPGLALYKLQANSYKFSWLLIPLSVPFVWLLFFWTRRFRTYDHTVFVTYSLAFMSLLAIAVMVMGFAGVPVAIFASIAVFLPPIHMYKQLRGAYAIGRLGAAIRLILLSSFGIVAFTFFFVLLLGIGALG